MSYFDQAAEKLLSPTGLTWNTLARVFDRLGVSQLDDADLYFQQSFSESWRLEEGIVKSSSYHIASGVGLRAVAGAQTGFAYTTRFEEDALLKAAEAARQFKSFTEPSASKTFIWRKTEPVALYQPDNPLASFSEAEKVTFLQQLDKLARSLDPRVKEVTLHLSGTHDTILVVDASGNQAADLRPLVHFSVSVIAENAQGRRENGQAGGGGRRDYPFFSNEAFAEGLVRDAVRQALVNLDAIPAPAGIFPVVLGGGWPGVLLHEAVGHGLEGDFNRKGTSAYTGKIGQKVASPLCTVVDNGTLPHRRGSLTVDDEGQPTQCTTLIEKGILRGYLQDKLNARLMKMAPTGNGRRESYACLPMPRMTNTYLLPGQHAPEEILSSVDKGIYAVNFAGGQVDITSGQFVFSASEAYLIEHGKVTAPLKGVTFIGNGPEVLNYVSMVGNDLQLDQGIGVCGKNGQSVPVGVGQPTLKIDQMTVGGTEHGAH